MKEEKDSTQGTQVSRRTCTSNMDKYTAENRTRVNCTPVASCTSWVAWQRTTLSPQDFFGTLLLCFGDFLGTRFEDLLVCFGDASVCFGDVSVCCGDASVCFGRGFWGVCCMSLGLRKTQIHVSDWVWMSSPLQPSSSVTISNSTQAGPLYYIHLKIVTIIPYNSSFFFKLKKRIKPTSKKTSGNGVFD